MNHLPSPSWGNKCSSTPPACSESALASLPSWTCLELWNSLSSLSLSAILLKFAFHYVVINSENELTWMTRETFTKSFKTDLKYGFKRSTASLLTDVTSMSRLNLLGLVFSHLYYIIYMYRTLLGISTAWVSYFCVELLFHKSDFSGLLLYCMKLDSFLVFWTCSI